MSRRLDYIDTLKGFAIIYVVLLHCFVFVPIYTPSIAVIPLFFILSGLFHKGDKPFGLFIGKQAFTLLIPYATYNIIPHLICMLLNKAQFFLPNNHDILSPFYAHHIDQLINYPLWFLPALFVAQVIFYFIEKISSKCGRWGFAITSFSALAIGYIGYCCELLPFFIDRGLVGVMFYCMGYLVAHTPMWKNPTRYDKVGYCLIIPFAILYLLTRNRIDMAFNTYNMAYVTLIIHIFALFAATLYGCKLIKKVPLITYMGRHSLIVLCTHAILIAPLYIILHRFIHTPYNPFILATIVIILLYYVAIPFCRKFLPYISGITPRR